MSSERAPSLSEVIRRAIYAAQGDIHTAISARVEKFDEGLQRADCKVTVMRGYIDEEDERQVEDLPVVPGVPVLFLEGGGFRLTFPVVPGTTGMLVFAERSLDAWLTGKGQVVDPQIDHMHAMCDAIFVPGLKPFGAPLDNFHMDCAFLGRSTDSPRRIAREGDSVNVSIPSGTVLVDSPGGPIPNSVPISLDGTITSGSDDLKTS